MQYLLKFNEEKTDLQWKYSKHVEKSEFKLYLPHYLLYFSFGSQLFLTFLGSWVLKMNQCQDLWKNKSDKSIKVKLCLSDNFLSAWRCFCTCEVNLFAIKCNTQGCCFYLLSFKKIKHFSLQMTSSSATCIKPCYCWFFVYFHPLSSSYRWILPFFAASWQQ